MCAMGWVALFMTQIIQSTYSEQANVFKVRVHIQSEVGRTWLSIQGTRTRVCCGAQESFGGEKEMQNVQLTVRYTVQTGVKINFLKSHLPAADR